MLRAVRDGHLEAGQDVLERLAQCTSCGHCQQSCVTGLEITDVFERARHDILHSGTGHLPEHQKLTQSIRNYGNPWQQPRSRRGDWAKGLGVKDASLGEAGVLFYPGCTYSYDPGLREKVRSFAEQNETQIRVSVQRAGRSVNQNPLSLFAAEPSAGDAHHRIIREAVPSPQINGLNSGEAARVDGVIDN